MAYTKTIMCLANSRKHMESCIAGREPIGDLPRGWVRPVSRRDGKGISLTERRYDNGIFADVGDIVQIEMRKPVPHGCHVEDHLIDHECRWKKVGELNWEMIEALVEPQDNPLWIESGAGFSNLDRLTAQHAHSLDSSLRLVRPYDFQLVVRSEWNKMVVRASFRVAGYRHRLKVTDPYARDAYLQRGYGVYDLSGAIACISLTEPFKDRVYFSPPHDFFGQ